MTKKRTSGLSVLRKNLENSKPPSELKEKLNTPDIKQGAELASAAAAVDSHFEQEAVNEETKTNEISNITAAAENTNQEEIKQEEAPAVEAETAPDLTKTRRRRKPYADYFKQKDELKKAKFASTCPHVYEKIYKPLGLLAKIESISTEMLINNILKEWLEENKSYTEEKIKEYIKNMTF